MAALPRRDGDRDRLAGATASSRTMEVSERLAAAGIAVVPHLAARMIADRAELSAVVAAPRAAGIPEAFVVGGDASPPAGSFVDAGDLLDVLAELPDRFTADRRGRLPGGPPKDPRGGLREALLRKQEYADYVATQICFDAGGPGGLDRGMREAGMGLPVVVGLPGVVDRRKLAEISLQTGVGPSVRYLIRHGRQVAALARAAATTPRRWRARSRRRPRTRASDIGGVHLFTFNQVEATDAWVRRRPPSDAPRGLCPPLAYGVGGLAAGPVAGSVPTPSGRSLGLVLAFRREGPCPAPSPEG